MESPHRVPKKDLIPLNEFIRNLHIYRKSSSSYIYLGFPEKTHTIDDVEKIADKYLSPIVVRNKYDSSYYSGSCFRFSYTSFTVSDEKLKPFIEAAIKIKAYIYIRKSLLSTKLKLYDDPNTLEDSDFYTIEDFFNRNIEIQKIIL